MLKRKRASFNLYLLCVGGGRVSPGIIWDWLSPNEHYRGAVRAILSNLELGIIYCQCCVPIGRLDYPPNCVGVMMRITWGLIALSQILWTQSGSMRRTLSSKRLAENGSRICVQEPEINPEGCERSMCGVSSSGGMFKHLSPCSWGFIYALVRTRGSRTINPKKKYQVKWFRMSHIPDEQEFRLSNSD